MDDHIYNKQELNLLYTEFKKFNLVEFIEKETGRTLNKNKDDYSCLCPMKQHRDSKPSFHVYKDEASDCWIYNCFGCGSKGTIIDFCIDYKELEDNGKGKSYEAIVYLAEKLKIKDTYDIAIQAIKNVKIDVNFKKILDSEHFLASKRCFQLLKKYNKSKEWVFDAYKQMNNMLSKEDIHGIEKISEQAIKMYNNYNI
jgi:hypothetical protein